MKRNRLFVVFCATFIILALTGCSKRFMFRAKVKADKPAAAQPAKKDRFEAMAPDSFVQEQEATLPDTRVAYTQPEDTISTAAQSASLHRAPLPFRLEQLSAEEVPPPKLGIIHPNGQGGIINVLSFLLALTAVFLAILAIAGGGLGLATLSLLVALAAFALAIIGISMRRRLNGLSIAALVLASLHILFTLMLLIVFSLESI